MKKKKRLKNNIRYSKLVIFISLLLFCVMIGRVIQLGTFKKIDGIELKKLASQRTTKTDVISANRGTIYSVNGETLAQNVASYKLIAYLDSKRTTNEKKPQHVVDKEETAEKLAPILEMEKDEVLYYLNKKGVYQTEFGSKGKALNELTKTKIDDLNLPGLDFIENYKRYYPKGNFASYVVGYAKTENDENSTIKGECHRCKDGYYMKNQACIKLTIEKCKLDSMVKDELIYECLDFCEEKGLPLVVMVNETKNGKDYKPLTQLYDMYYFDYYISNNTKDPINLNISLCIDNSQENLQNCIIAF